MAERRMFAKTIIDSDAFLDMPMSSQCLYFHLSMRADDEGFINNPKKITRMIGASDDDLKILIAKSFLITFETGVVAIKHWRLHNYIQKDRFKQTVYQEERAMLELKNNGAYTLDTECIQDVYSLETQDSIGKDSIGKDSIGKDKKSAKAPTVWYPNDELLNEAFNDYIKHRKKMKKPIDEYKAEGVIKKLDKLSGGDSEKAIAIIKQSIDERWIGLFELKENKKPQATGSIVDDWLNA